MKFTVITVDQFNKDHGTNWKAPMSEYRGELIGYQMGFTPEVKLKDGTLDAESTTFVYNAEDLNDDFWTWHRDEMSHRYEWTGRLVFRGYYSSHYDFEEREEYFKEERV